MPVTDSRPEWLREYDDGRYDHVAPGPPICPEHGPREVAAGLPDHPGYSGWGKVQALSGEWIPCFLCGDCGRVLLVDKGPIEDEGQLGDLAAHHADLSGSRELQQLTNRVEKWHHEYAAAVAVGLRQRGLDFEAMRQAAVEAAQGATWEPLTPEDLMRISEVVHQNYHMPTVFATVAEVVRAYRGKHLPDAPARDDLRELLQEEIDLGGDATSLTETVRQWLDDVGASDPQRDAELAHAWDQGRAAERRDWELTAEVATPDEDRTPWVNPYETVHPSSTSDVESPREDRRGQA